MSVGSIEIVFENFVLFYLAHREKVFAFCMAYIHVRSTSIRRARLFSISRPVYILYPRA